MNIPEDQEESGSGVRNWVDAAFFGKDAAEVTTKIKNFHDKYPTQGYDTHIIVGPRESPEGYWWTKVRRFSTCS